MNLIGRWCRWSSIDRRLNRNIGRKDGDRHLRLNKQINPGVLCRCRLRFKRRFWRTLDSLVVRIFCHSACHSWASNLRKVQFSTHSRGIREWFLILGQHCVLNGRWWFVNIVVSHLRPPCHRCLDGVDPHGRHLTRHWRWWWRWRRHGTKSCH